MRGTTTRWATLVEWSTWLILSWSEVYDVGGPQLPHRHSQLLELYAHRRRIAHAGAAALLHARLYAVYARFSVPALRDGRHLRQPRRRLARDALWHSAHARGRPGPP